MPRWAPPLALALVLLAPLAAAQVPAVPDLPADVPPVGTTDARITLEVQDPGGPLVPTRPYALTVLVHYIYGAGGVAPDEEPCATVTAPDPPPWAEVRVFPDVVCFPINPTFAPGGTTVTNQTILEVNVTEDAPALEPYDLTVAAHAPATGVFQEASGEQTRTIVPGFVGRIEVHGPERMVLQGGREEQVPITIVNRGNGPIEVHFRNFTAPQGMRVTLPERVTLPTPGSEATVYATLQAPWTTPVRGQVELRGETSHPSRPDLTGDEPRTRFDVQGKTAVPGPDLALLALAGLGVALAARRRR